MKRSNSDISNISNTSTNSTTLQYKIAKNTLLTKEYQLHNRYSDQLYTFKPIKGEYSQLLKYTVPVTKVRPGKWQNTNKYLEVRGFAGVINFQTLEPTKEYQIDICSMERKKPEQYTWKWLECENCFVLMTIDSRTLVAKLKPAKFFTRELATLTIYETFNITLKTSILTTSVIIWDEYYKSIPTFSRVLTRRNSFPVLWKCLTSY